MSLAISLNKGLSITSLSQIPWIAETSGGIGIVGLTTHRWFSSFPLGYTFNMAISTILSLEMLIPVVSRSKKQIGLVRFRDIFCD